jgi:hypothetical protein
MKEKVMLWVVNILLSKIDANVIENTNKKRVRTLIFQLYNENLTPQITDREISAMIFDAKYTETILELGFRSVTSEDPRPSELLSVYYLKANKGDTSFMRETFYRHLAQVGDNEIRKLRYRIKRNQ